ncbi:flavin reductase family protein [Acidianus manzaensis]|uniref:Flavin reductase n=1 Tax=Acidianus manzaensis TaxID=282676 RepID=A0A1W6JZ40_9CREN|nr:flavin reductase family protein [Acidianus manzaensis]ARM75517.1 flavin reductase [Acidianus manzaensis]
MQEELKNIMRRYPLGVSIVTTKWKDLLVGLTVNTFNSLSLDPTLIVFFADKTKSNDIPFKESKNFLINFTDNIDVLNIFATKPFKERFNMVKYSEDDEGLPILNDSYAYIKATLYNAIDIGDHSVITGKVKNIKILREQFDPIVYYNRKYYRINNNL